MSNVAHQLSFHIATLNNQGAESLRCGNTEAAMASLSEALYTTNTWLKETNTTSCTASFDIDELMQRPEASQSNTADGYSSDIAYRSPIFVPDTDKLPGPQTCGVFLSAVIIFNLALAYHFHATETEHLVDREVYLKKAKMLYQLAIRSQEQQIENHTKIFKLFFLSCVNNLGIVHRLLGDAHAADECFQRLLTILMYLKYCEEGHPCICMAFFHNIFGGDNSAAAAPAA